MKRTPLLSAILFAAILLSSCSEKNSEADKKAVEISTDSLVAKNTYDADLATSLGADEYGMKQYVLAFLKRGPNRNQDSVTAENLQKAHLQNITRLANEGKLVLAGPFLDDTDIRGIYIFNVTSLEEARKLTESDPAIKAGRLVMELHPWYGSAALMQVNKIHGMLEKKSVAE
jgi:uncharacterized protein YciI